MSDAPYYLPMTKAIADELFAGIADVIDGQPAEIRERLRMAIYDGLYDLVAATPDQLVINVRGIGELMVARVPFLKVDEGRPQA